MTMNQIDAFMWAIGKIEDATNEAIQNVRAGAKMPEYGHSLKAGDGDVRCEWCDTSPAHNSYQEVCIKWR
jgi:hypothetical protein